MVSNMAIEFAAVFSLWILCVNADDQSKAMRTMSYSFSRKLYDCNKQWPIREDVVNDLRHFWRLDYQLSKRAIGCAIICMATKLHFLDNRGNFIIEHAIGFTKAGGADDEMSHGILSLIAECRNSTKSQDPCNMALNIANCFRNGAQDRHWVPNMGPI
ncbi:hypothetical protein evm_002396 [Chilo suppressalis]|nr:hypothetical protein evm_002396 [Chilo suppressalis]